MGVNRMSQTYVSMHRDLCAFLETSLLQIHRGTLLTIVINFASRLWQSFEFTTEQFRCLSETRVESLRRLRNKNDYKK